MPISRAGSLLCVCGGEGQRLQPPKATTEAVTPLTLTVTRTGPRRKTPPSAPQEALMGKARLTSSQPSTQEARAAPSGLTGAPARRSRAQGGRLTLLLSWPCDCNPRSQVKSPSSKNSHPSSLPTQQPGRAQGQAGLGTQPRGSSWDEADRRPPLEGQPGLLTPPLCRRGPSPSPASKPLPAHQLCQDQGTLVPGRQVPPRRNTVLGPQVTEGPKRALRQISPDLARRGKHSHERHPRQKKDMGPRLFGLCQSPWKRWKVKMEDEADTAPGE